MTDLRQRLNRKKARLDYRERRLRQRERHLLEKHAEILREADCHVRLPGNWLPATPALDLDVPRRVDRALKTAYDLGRRDPRLTARSYAGGGLTIDDLAGDLEVLREVLARQEQVGPRTVQSLEERLRRTGALDRAAACED
jgi:hypothetical protein